MISFLTEYSSDLFNLFYPDICVSCSRKLLKGETIICLRCENDLQQTDHWKNPENLLARRFWGRTTLQGAAAVYQFHKGNEVQHLLHQLKYRGRKDIGEFVGKIAGLKLQCEGSTMSKPDVIVPVPLHWKKQKIRGYNQCDSFALGISQVLNVPVSKNCVERMHENISQTQKKRFDRWGNVAGIFYVKNKEELQGKHVLLVDDVVTTGATAEACLETILSVGDVKASFVAIAMAGK